MALQIPNENLQAIAKIVALPETAIDELVNALGSTTITAESSAMAASIEPNVPSIPQDDLREIVETLYSLYHVREFTEVRAPRFVRDLVDAVLQSPDLGFNKTEHASLIGKRFQRLLNVKTLDVLSKAVRLQRETGCVFCGAKILSDIRPVFGDDPIGAPIGAVIIHTLKLACHESGQHREYLFVLDQQDLEKLGDIVDRAREKERKLDQVLERLSLPRLGV